MRSNLLLILGSVFGWDDHFEFNNQGESTYDDDERVISFPPSANYLAPDAVNLADEKCKYSVRNELRLNTKFS